jgi:hypothetical protein
LEFEINTSIGNSSWNKKLQGIAAKALDEDDQSHKGLNNSHMNITKDLTSFKDWTAELIDERTKWIADEIEKLTSVSSAQGGPHKVKSFKLG